MADRGSWRAARPAALALVLFAAATACGAAETAIAVADSAGRPLARAVVAVVVKGVRNTAAPGIEAQMGQRERQFSPQVLAVQTGTAVQFPNFDTVRHHVYSFSAIRRFELKLYVGTPSAPVVFDKPGIAVLGCNIHDRMSGWIAVVDTPHFGITGADGQVVLDLPAGRHRLQVWHPALGEAGSWQEQTLTVADTRGQVAVVLPVTAAPGL